MRMLSLISTLLVVGNTAVTARGGDLTKIDRTIAKEPAYQSKSPSYGLLVFGPEAKSRAWATVNKDSGGGKKSGSGRGKKESHASSRKGGRKAGRKK